MSAVVEFCPATGGGAAVRLQTIDFIIKIDICDQDVKMLKASVSTTLMNP